jgi:hypothetical protein
MIVTFLAMLEMIRLKLIRVFQQGGQGAIRVYKRAGPPTRRTRFTILKMSTRRITRRSRRRDEDEMSDEDLKCLRCRCSA